jgi:hypothetical protein
MDYYTAQFQIKFTRGAVNSFVLQHLSDEIQTKSAPEEEQRSQVPRVFLETISQDLQDYLRGCVAELVFNLDEVAISDWPDETSRSLPKCVTYFSDRLCAICWRITYR